MIFTRKIEIKKMLINRIIWYLTLSDIFSWGFFSVLSSIIGIYLAEKFDGKALTFIGIGLATYYFFRGISQIPLSKITDGIKGEKDDAIFLIIGNILLGAPFLFYPFIFNPLLYYFLQMVMGIGAAMNVLSWRKIFAKNLDVGKEGYDYAIYDATISTAMIFISIIAGVIANISSYYFNVVIFGTGLLIMSSSIFALMIYRSILRKEKLK